MLFRSTGKVIGKSDNGCFFDGKILGRAAKTSVKINMTIYKCPEPDLNRRFTGVFDKNGTLIAIWEMKDGNYPVVSSVNAKLFRDTESFQ